MKRVLCMIILLLSLASISIAKVEYKPLENEEIVVIVNGVEIDQARVNELGKHWAGSHGSKNYKDTPMSSYLGKIIERELVLGHAIKEKTKDTVYFKFAANMVFVDKVLDAFLVKELNDKIDIDDPQKKQERFAEMIEEKCAECAKKYKIEVYKDIVQQAALEKNSDLSQVVARVDDYEVLLRDVIFGSSKYAYNHLRPYTIRQSYLDDELDVLVKRAMLYKEAVSLGYDKDVQSLSGKEEEKLIRQVYDKNVSMGLTVTDEEIEKILQNDKLKNKVFKQNARWKYGVIQKYKKEDLEPIKERLAKGEDFFKIAKTESDSKILRKIGGLRDYVNKAGPGVLITFSNLEDGEVSDIFASGEEFLIIKRIDSIFDTVERIKPVIDAGLRNGKIRHVMRDRIDKLIEEAEIVINSNVIKEEVF